MRSTGSSASPIPEIGSRPHGQSSGPSAAMQQQELGLGPSQVKNLNRQLVELGLVVMKDSPNGKRYGRRDPQGRIVEAYGFDLSPLASRHAEFKAEAEAGREERARVQALRRRANDRPKWHPAAPGNGHRARNN